MRNEHIVLVTGGTGFLGRHLVHLLAASGERVRALARKAPSQPEKNVEFIEGSVLDRTTVQEAVEGCSRIFHLAGTVSRRREDADAMYRVHIDGTRNLLEAARKSRIKRVVLASSSGTVGVSADADAITTEQTPYPFEILKRWPYYLSKVYQEREALDFGRRNEIEVVSINPSLLLGPGDDRLSSTEDVLNFLRGRIPAIPSGGLSFVDARDAALAAQAAMERGRPGERYLLGAANWSFERFMRKLEQISGVLGPRLRVPRRLTDIGLDVLHKVSRITGRGSGDAVSVEMSQFYWYIDSSKAERDLGFKPRDVDETLVETVRFLRRHFAIPQTSSRGLQEDGWSHS